MPLIHEGPFIVFSPATIRSAQSANGILVSMFSCVALIKQYEKAYKSATNEVFKNAFALSIAQSAKNFFQLMDSLDKILTRQVFDCFLRLPGAPKSFSLLLKAAAEVSSAVQRIAKVPGPHQEEAIALCRPNI